MNIHITFFDLRATEDQDTNFLITRVPVTLLGGEETNLAKVIKAIILYSSTTYG